MGPRGRLPGLILIAIGGFFLLANNGYLRDESLLIFLGAAFIAGYALTGRRVGLLVAGCIISTVGAYALLENRVLPHDSGGIFLMMLGGAFLLVFGIHTAHQTGHSRYWPLYPGGILLAIGTLTFASENRYWANWLGLLWPIAIIAIGCLLYYRSRPLDR